MYNTLRKPMKRIVYFLTIFLFLSSNSSFAMQPSLSTREMCILTCIAAGCACGLSLCVAYDHKDSIIDWLRYLAYGNKSDTAAQKHQKQTKEQMRTTTNTSVVPLSVRLSVQQRDNIVLTPEDITKITANRKARQQKKNDGVRELHQACLDNDVQKVKKLLEDGCMHINETSCIRRKFNNSENSAYYQTQATPLHIAINNKNNAIIDLLLTHNDIDLSIVDSKGNTSLCYACQQNDSNTVKKLLVHNNMKCTDAGALLIACSCGHKEIVTLLLAYNKDHDNCMKINDQISNISNFSYIMKTPLLEACHQIRQCALKRQESKNDHAQFMYIIHALLEDQYVDFKHIADHESIFHIAAVEEKLLELLLEKNKSLPEDKRCSVNAYISQFARSTPLHAAVVYGNIKSIQLLIENGADVTIQNCDKRTPFLRAFDRDHEKPREDYISIVTYFLTLPQVTQDKDQLSAGLLESIGFDEDDDIARQLLVCGADPNKKNKDCWSALLKVARWKKLSLLNLCIDQYNGDVTQQDGTNNTIFYLVYMANTIQQVRDINCLQKFNDDEKKEFMQRELTIIVDRCPESLFCQRWDEYREEVDQISSVISRFSNFVATCISFGKIDVYEKIGENTDETLLDVAYKKAQIRLNTGYDAKFLRFNDVVVHALLPHYSDTCLSREEMVDKKIAQIYQKVPAQYYLQSSHEKLESRLSVEEYYYF
jgi:ankyrin repeat protein